MQVARVAPDWLVPSLMHRRRVLGDCIAYIGLDVHKDGIAVAVAEGGLRGEVREYSRIATRRRRCGGQLEGQGCGSAMRRGRAVMQLAGPVQFRQTAHPADPS